MDDMLSKRILRKRGLEQNIKIHTLGKVLREYVYRSA